MCTFAQLTRVLIILTKLDLVKEYIVLFHSNVITFLKNSHLSN